MAELLNSEGGRDGMMRNRPSPVLAAVLLAALSAGANEIFVSPKGDDRNIGSSSKPVATISRAVEKASPGDVIRVLPGLFREEISIRKSGTAEKPITIVGTRKNGEYLSIVEPPGVALTDWRPAPEVAPDVWKVALEDPPKIVMMDGKMIALINRTTMGLPRWERLPKLPEEYKDEMLMDKFDGPEPGSECKRLPGLDWLALPLEAACSNRMTVVQYFPLFGNVLSGWREGCLYVRMADGRRPQDRKFVASTGNGFVLDGASHWVLRDLHLRGSRHQVWLRGKSSSNTIEGCLMMHGGARVRIDRDVTDTTVRGNVLTCGFIQSDLFKLRGDDDRVGFMMYKLFKYLIGTSLSDDVGIRCDGSKTRIHDNIIAKGLIGMDAVGPGMDVARNVVRDMSSVGICSGPHTVALIHDNIIMNCGIPIRVHEYHHYNVRREEYYYRNLIIQRKHAGSMIFVHSESQTWGDDVVNFKPGTREYLENPPSPFDAGKFYFYHNTFWGGDDYEWCGVLTTYSLYNKFRKKTLPFHFINNIAKSHGTLSAAQQTLIAGNAFYFTPTPPFSRIPAEEAVCRDNLILKPEDGNRIWNDNPSPEGLVDLTLPRTSPVRGAAIDISKPFKSGNCEFAALPGFKPGYYSGRAPSPGALQFGESQREFEEMYRKSCEAVEKLRGTDTYAGFVQALGKNARKRKTPQEVAVDRAILRKRALISAVDYAVSVKDFHLCLKYFHQILDLPDLPPEERARTYLEMARTQQWRMHDEDGARKSRELYKKAMEKLQ